MDTLKDWLGLIRDGGLALMVFVLAIGGARGWYVFGWLYRKAEKDRDEWKALATGAIASIKDVVESIELVLEQRMRRR